MTLCTKKRVSSSWIIAIILLYLAITCVNPADAIIIEPNPDLQLVMGDLYSLSVAMRLYYDDTHKTKCPALHELSHYMKKPLPDSWPADYQTAENGGDWWVGRRVPEFSTARKFLRDNAPSLGLYEQASAGTWLGEAFVWMNAVPFDNKAKPPVPEIAVYKVAQGEGNDSQHLFFNSPGTDYYWRSEFLYTTEAHASALKKLGTDAKGPFVMPSPLPGAPERFTASPVEVPPDFTLSGEEEIEVKLGDVLFNPVPRQNDN